MNTQRPDAERCTLFEQLYQQYQPELYRFAYRQLRDPDQAGDILQETYLKAWRAWPPAVSDRGLRAWLYRIADNTIKDQRRRQRRRLVYPLLPFEDLNTNLVDRQAALELTRFAIREQIREVLRELPEHYRAVLLLYGSYSYREIAQALHLSVAATRMRIFRARQAFQEHYLERDSVSGLIWKPHVAKTEEKDVSHITP